MKIIASYLINSFYPRSSVVKLVTHEDVEVLIKFIKEKFLKYEASNKDSFRSLVYDLVFEKAL